MIAGLEPAFVIHSRPYRETSLLLEVLSSEHGRFGLVARGARRPRSALRTRLQPFLPLQMAWSGRGELPTLRSAEPEGSAWRFSGAALASALYVNELLYRLLPRHDPCAVLFAQYVATLRALAADGSPQPALRLFEKRLLETLGYALMLDYEADTGRPVEPGETYAYDPHAGPRPVGNAGAGIRLRGESLLALAAERLEGEEVLREVRALMRGVLDAHLGGRPLRSRELLQKPSVR